jgi:HD-GYP domain-containing protein (c-di-GMP phosphodiesterase class II)
LEAIDKYSHGHSERTMKIVITIASELNIPPDYVEKIRAVGLLSDIGKISVKESILDKPGRLLMKYLTTSKLILK